MGAFNSVPPPPPPRTPVALILALGATSLIGTAVLLFALLYFFAPTPRPPRKSEKHYITTTANGGISTPQVLPCWFDNYVSLGELARKGMISREEAYQTPGAEVFMSLVIPAYNEQDRLSGMLEEAVDYLQAQYTPYGTKSISSDNVNGAIISNDPRRGWEIILVSDGSTDKTVDVAVRFAQTYHLRGAAAHKTSKGAAGKAPVAPQRLPILPGTIRIVTLEQNRGKGGAVTHGMRHARGTWVMFADADGASKFSDLGKLVTECSIRRDTKGRVVGVGSRAHMVGTDAVVKRSALRNLLMRGFHLGIWLMTTPRVAKVRDTQCGFKLFSRPSLPYIIPFMHTEGWIFDVEMLMLAESAQIPMVEVAIGWKEVQGSKLNVIKDSLGMAWGLALLRVAWSTGIYRRD